MHFNILLILVLCASSLYGKTMHEGQKSRTTSRHEISRTISSTLLPLYPSDTIDPHINQTASFRPVHKYYEEDHIKRILRSFGSDTFSFVIQLDHRGGESSHTVLERIPEQWGNEGLNRIEQLSTNVLCYKGIPVHEKGMFFIPLQPLILEFMDSSFHILKEIDVWASRPYREIGDKRLGYYGFYAEYMSVIPYHHQSNISEPDHYSLFTHVQSAGNHVIINYELRGMKEYAVVNVEHTLHVYDLKGNLNHVLEFSSVDGAVISNDGKYMMYTFGGIGLGNADQPFATIEREGWALFRLLDKKVVYSEFTDNGKLAYNGISMEQGLLRVAYSTPRTDDGVYDYHIFFLDTTETLYKKLWPTKEWDDLVSEWRQTGIQSWMYYIEKYNFETIHIGNGK